jgi:hypothetical protein
VRLAEAGKTSINPADLRSILPIRSIRRDRQR